MDKGVLQDLQHGTGFGENIHFEVQVCFRKRGVSDSTSQCPGMSPLLAAPFFPLPWCQVESRWGLTCSADDRAASRAALEGQLTWKNFRSSSASACPSRAPSPRRRRRVLDFSPINPPGNLQDCSRSSWCFAHLAAWWQRSCFVLTETFAHQGSQQLKSLDFTVITCCVCPSKTISDGAKVGSDSLNIRYGRTGVSMGNPESCCSLRASLSLSPALSCLGNQASSCIPHPPASLGRGCQSRDAVLPHRAHERCSSVPGPSINPTPFAAHHSAPAQSCCCWSSPVWPWLSYTNFPHCLNRETRSKSL